MGELIFTAQPDLGWGRDDLFYEILSLNLHSAFRSAPQPGLIMPYRSHTWKRRKRYLQWPLDAMPAWSVALFSSIMGCPRFTSAHWQCIAFLPSETTSSACLLAVLWAESLPQHSLLSKLPRLPQIPPLVSSTPCILSVVCRCRLVWPAAGRKLAAMAAPEEEALAGRTLLAARYRLPFSVLILLAPTALSDWLWHGQRISPTDGPGGRQPRLCECTLSGCGDQSCQSGISKELPVTALWRQHQAMPRIDKF